MLPNELYHHHILPELSPTTISTFRSVCRHFTTVVESPAFCKSYLSGRLHTWYNELLVYLSEQSSVKSFLFILRNAERVNHVTDLRIIDFCYQRLALRGAEVDLLFALLCDRKHFSHYIYGNISPSCIYSIKCNLLPLFQQYLDDGESKSHLDIFTEQYYQMKPRFTALYNKKQPNLVTLEIVRLFGDRIHLDGIHNHYLFYKQHGNYNRSVPVKMFLDDLYYTLIKLDHPLLYVKCVANLCLRKYCPMDTFLRYHSRDHLITKGLFTLEEIEARHASSCIDIECIFEHMKRGTCVEAHRCLEASEFVLLVDRLEREEVRSIYYADYIELASLNGYTHRAHEMVLLRPEYKPTLI